jgi:RNA polymerase subunit RPABC4/transcription elongation factor Spt4
MTTFPTKTKYCPRCEESRELSSFYKRKRSHDGLDYWCKICRKSIYMSRRTDPILRERDKKACREYKTRKAREYWRDKNE